jgi:protein transport protein SEC13
LSWSHPKYGNLIATGGSDQKVVIWKEQSTNKWTVIYEYLGHSGPITSISFSPYTLGLMLAAASSDGCVSILLLDSNEKWTSTCFHAHDNGALQVCWSPPSESLLLPEESPVRFASSGADGSVKVWTYDQGEYTADTLTRHKASVRALAWDEEILSGSEDGLVVVWSPGEDGWTAQDLAEFKVPVHGLAVNEFGRQVVVSLGNGESKVFDRNEGWRVLGVVDESGHVKE